MHALPQSISNARPRVLLTSWASEGTEAATPLNSTGACRQWCADHSSGHACDQAPAGGDDGDDDVVMAQSEQRRQ
eukprot:452428-Pelagomonas_calceolata.AAC.1